MDARRVPTSENEHIMKIINVDAKYRRVARIVYLGRYRGAWGLSATDSQSMFAF